MNWNLALVGALLFLFPGFCAYAGFLHGSTHDKLTALPETSPRSLSSLFLILAWALVAHVAGAGLFYYQAYACDTSHMCHRVAFDPNPYKLLFLRSETFAQSDAAIFWTLVGILCLGGVSAVISSALANIRSVQDFIRPDFSGWLRDIADQAAEPSVAVIGYVLCKLGDDGIYAGYEGVVIKLSRGLNDEVTMIVLGGVDRFTVKIDARGVHRLGRPRDKMQYLQISQGEFSNVSFDILPMDNL